MMKVYAQVSASAGRQILANGRGGRTAAGRANGQNAASERAALNMMTPNQIRQSANRYNRARAGANR